MTTELDWNKKYIILFQSTIDTTLRNFQYKFIHRLTTTNTMLFRYKLSNSNLCDFCGSNIETFHHLFWECTIVQNLWSELHSFLLSINIEFSYNKETVFFGELKNNINGNVINFIIILMKYYIFKMKYQKQKPTLDVFKNFLMLRIQIEEEIGLSNDKLELQKQKWNKLSNALTNK